MTNMPDFEALNCSPGNVKENEEIKVYPKRWLILISTIFYSIASFLQFLEYSVVADVITEYYQVSYEAVDWTSLVVPAVFVVFSIPVTHWLDIYGLRKIVLVGVIGTAIGSCIKVGSVSPDRFWLLLLGQAIIAIFQIFIYPLLPKVAATWFGYNQIAVAYGLGLIGIQAGSAISFLIPPSLVFKGEVGEIQRGIYILNIVYASISVALIPFVLFFFDDKPPTPPSLAKQQSIKEQLTHSKSLWETLKALLKMRSFMTFLVIYGVNFGVTWPFQILSNQIILSYYPDAAYDVGVIGLLQVIFGIPGTMIVSVLLDKLKKFRETCWIVYGLYLMMVVIYVATLDQGIVCIYITSTLMGILIGGQLTVGMELMMEFSYPVPEGTPVTFVSWFTQFLSLGLTYLCGYLLRTVSALWATIMLVIFVVVADLLFFILKFDLKRQAMQESRSNKLEKQFMFTNK